MIKSILKVISSLDIVQRAVFLFISVIFLFLGAKIATDNPPFAVIIVAPLVVLFFIAWIIFCAPFSPSARAAARKKSEDSTG